MGRKVIVIVDMQNDFVYGTLGNKEAQAIVPKMCAQLDEYLEGAEKDVYLTFTRDTHYKETYDQTEEGKNVIPHCIKDTEGWEIIAPLARYAYDDMIVDKGAFGSLCLMNDLRDFLYPDDEVEFWGVCTDICVISNALMARAHFPYNKISVNSQLCAGTTPEAHSYALSVMRHNCIEVI